MLKLGLAIGCTLGLTVIGCDRGPSASGKASAGKKVVPSDARNAKVDTVIHPAPRYVDQSLLGAQVGPDGKVTSESTSFRAGQPIYLTMVLTESPPGLQTRAVWRDPKDKIIRTDQKKMNGGKVATFTLNEVKLKPGKYHVVGYWGGNLAADKTFEIVAASKRKK